jgi:CRISPR-associated endonuclease/helicase Cas3
MVTAFLRGIGQRPTQARRLSQSCVAFAYPLLTSVSAVEIKEIEPGADPTLARQIEVVRLASRDAALREAADSAEKGAAVAVICNSVDEAIRFYARLAAERREGTVHLFHARFTQGDRLAIEFDVLQRFGRAPKKERAGHVLVATQVIEQSLDLDFDLMITDLAPIDLMIQRAGRLWRHVDARPQSSRALPRPQLMVVSPDLDQIENPGWLLGCLGNAAYVYQDAAVMWRSARRIFADRWLRTPDDLRPCVEAVYGDGAVDIPDILRDAAQRGAGRQAAERTLGTMNVIDLEAGYWSMTGVGTDEDIGTRLGEPTVTVRLARRQGDRLMPWIEGNDLSRRLAWALSEIKVRANFWRDALPPDADSALHKRSRAEWTEWESSIRLAEVELNGRLRIGPELHYSAARGLYKPVHSLR